MKDYLLKQWSNRFEYSWALCFRQDTPILLHHKSTNAVESYYSQIKSGSSAMNTLFGSAQNIIQLNLKMYEVAHAYARKEQGSDFRNLVVIYPTFKGLHLRLQKFVAGSLSLAHKMLEAGKMSKYIGSRGNMIYG